MWKKFREDAHKATQLFDGKVVQTPVFENYLIDLGEHQLVARVYDTKSSPDPRPTLVYFHGGGYVVNSVDTYDGLCCRLARLSGLRILSFEYRLAPEHPWPAAPNDALALHDWLTINGASIGVDMSRLAYGGDSAGGNLTAVLMQDLVSSGRPMPKAQMLIYPSLEATFRHPVFEDLKDAYVLDRRILAWFTGHYLPEVSKRDDPRASPLFSDHLAGQPPAYLLTAGFDPLRPDSEEYRERLEAAGVPVTYEEARGQIHAFITASGVLPDADIYLAKIAAWLKEAV